MKFADKLRHSPIRFIIWNAINILKLWRGISANIINKSII
jgi:hypothetical protein